jgi:glycosyltransferase involved in cell wall biosynthesis
VIQSSLEESGGLATMEGAAAGRLIIGTPVGYLGANGARGAGILVPLDEEGFLKETAKHLNYYRDNPTEYRQKCESMQQFARENYDWSVVIQNWVEVLS